MKHPAGMSDGDWDEAAEQFYAEGHTMSETRTLEERLLIATNLLHEAAGEIARLRLERSEPAAASVPLPNCICPTTYAHGMIIPIADGDCPRCFPKPVEAPEGAAPAVSREASVPQGGEFTAMELRHLIELTATQNQFTDRECQRICNVIRAYARALSSAPGEREGR
jgi:hypothetical protein